MFSSRISKLLKKSDKKIDAKALTQVEEVKPGKLSDANFLKVLDIYREKLAIADKKELRELTKLPTLFFKERNYKLTPFQKALASYTTALIYNTDWDAVQDEFKLAYMRFDDLRKKHPKLQEQLVANQPLFVNRFVLHADPMELIAGLPNPEAHFLLDANQDFVVKIFIEISALFAKINAFQYFTPYIMSYLVNDFYLPQAGIKSQAAMAPETSYLTQLTARHAEVKKFDHIYDPFLQQHQEPISDVLEKSLDDFEGHHSYISMRLDDLSFDEIKVVEEWKTKNLSSDQKEESKTTDAHKIKRKMNLLCLKVKFVFMEPGINKIDTISILMKEALKLYGDIAHFPVLLAHIYYLVVRLQLVDPAEQMKMYQEHQQYLNDKVAINQRDAMYIKALELLDEGEAQKNDALQLLKKISHAYPSALNQLRKLKEAEPMTVADRAALYYRTVEFIIRRARSGRVDDLYELGEQVSFNRENEMYLRAASRFSRYLSINLAEKKLSNAIIRHSIGTDEFADVISLYEQYLKFGRQRHNNNRYRRIFDLGRVLVPGADELNVRKALKWLWNRQARQNGLVDYNNNILAKTIEVLFATLTLSQQIQLLNVAIKLNPDPATREILVKRFNVLASKDGALECLADPLNIDFLNQEIKAKIAAKKNVVSGSPVTSLTRVHGAFKDKREEKGVEEVKMPTREFKK